MNTELIDNIICMYRASMLQKETKEDFLMRLSPTLNTMTNEEYLEVVLLLTAAGKSLATTQ